MEKDNYISLAEFEEIEKYLLRHMSPEEQNAFEKRLFADPVLQQTVNETRFLILGVEEAELFNKIQQFHKAMPLNRGLLKGYSLFKIMFAAAAIIVAIAVGSWLLFFGGNANEKLYAAYYNQDPGLITAMGVSENYEFDRAMIDYKTGEYKKARVEWQVLLKSNPASDTLNYFIASSYLAANEPEKAITHLASVINSGHSYFKKDALWYLGLAFLKLGNYRQAAAYIKQSDNPLKEELLDKIEKYNK